MWWAESRTLRSGRRRSKEAKNKPPVREVGVEPGKVDAEGQ